MISMQRCALIVAALGLTASACGPSGAGTAAPTTPPAAAAASPAPTMTSAPLATPNTTAPPLAQPSPALAGSPAPSGSPAASTAPGQPAAGSAPPPDITAVSEGKALIAQKGCGGCHIIPGIEGANGSVGPDLAGVASRTTLAGAVPHTGPDDLKRWILDPPALKPGTQMPNLGLTDEEATRITAYLETLK